METLITSETISQQTIGGESESENIEITNDIDLKLDHKVKI